MSSNLEVDVPRFLVIAKNERQRLATERRYGAIKKAHVS